MFKDNLKEQVKVSNIDNLGGGGIYFSLVLKHYFSQSLCC